MSVPYACGMFLTFFGVMFIAKSGSVSDMTAEIAAISFTVGLALMLKYK
jgi:drug/metabolite transporter (DMT)-like permease